MNYRAPVKTHYIIASFWCVCCPAKFEREQGKAPGSARSARCAVGAPFLVSTFAIPVSTFWSRERYHVLVRHRGTTVQPTHGGKSLDRATMESRAPPISRLADNLRFRSRRRTGRHRKGPLRSICGHSLGHWPLRPALPICAPRKRRPSDLDPQRFGSESLSHKSPPLQR